MNRNSVEVSAHASTADTQSSIDFELCKMPAADQRFAIRPEKSVGSNVQRQRRVRAKIEIGVDDIAVAHGKHAKGGGSLSIDELPCGVLR